MPSDLARVTTWSFWKSVCSLGRTLVVARTPRAAGEVAVHAAPVGAALVVAVVLVAVAAEVVRSVYLAAGSVDIESMLRAEQGS